MCVLTCVCAYVCIDVFAYVCACVCGSKSCFPRVRMRMRRWAEGGKGRPARFLWQRGMSGMSSTCI